MTALASATFVTGTAQRSIYQTVVNLSRSQEISQ